MRAAAIAESGLQFVATPENPRENQSALGSTESSVGSPSESELEP